MTPHELYLKLIKENNESMETPLPRKYEVDAETYAGVCQAIFDTNVKRELDIYDHVSGIREIPVILGENNGIIFKGVELLVKK